MVADYKEDPYQHVKRITITREGVHFDGAAYLTNPALAASDTSLATISCWLRAPPPPPGFGQILAIDPLGDYINYAFIGDNGLAGCFFNEPEPEGPDLGSFRFFGTVSIIDGKSHHLMIAADTSSQVAEFTIDRIPCGFTEIAEGHPFTLPIGGKPFVVGAFPEVPSPVFDLYDLWIDFGTFLSPYDSGVLNKFVIESFVPEGGIGGGTVRVLTPADLGARGERPTGERPTIFGRGPAETFLRPNLGNGGDFSLSGVLATVFGP